VLAGSLWFIPSMGDFLYGILSISLILIIVSSLLATFVPRLTPLFGSIYAFAYGALLGGVLILLNSYYPHVGTITVIATLILFAVTLIAYMIGAVKVTTVFNKVLTIGLISSLFLSLIFFGYSAIIGAEIDIIILIISIIYVFFGTMMLISQFDQAERIVSQNAPKQYEWSVAFGLSTTIIFVFVNLLRIVLYFVSRRK
jgi:uncharacterized YccA/Bax inhibitor family protein